MSGALLAIQHRLGRAGEVLAALARPKADLERGAVGQPAALVWEKSIEEHNGSRESRRRREESLVIGVKGVDKRDD